MTKIIPCHTIIHSLLIGIMIASSVLAVTWAYNISTIHPCVKDIKESAESIQSSLGGRASLGGQESKYTVDGRTALEQDSDGANGI